MCILAISQSYTGHISSNNLPFFLPATEGKPGSAGQTTLITGFGQNPADNKWMIRIWMDNRLDPQVSVGGGLQFLLEIRRKGDFNTGQPTPTGLLEVPSCSGQMDVITHAHAQTLRTCTRCP